MLLRDHANRGSLNCIRREFKFEFNSLTEADSFLFAHNSFIMLSTKKEPTSKKENSINSILSTRRNNRRLSSFHKKKYENSSSEEEEMENHDGKGGSIVRIHTCSRKKRSLHQDKRDAVVGSRRAKKKMKVNEDKVERKKMACEATRLSAFWIGNSANEMDDNFEHTPTPWGTNDDE